MALGLFKQLNHQPQFASTSYTLDDIPADDREQAVLLAFLAHSHRSLDVDTVATFVDANTIVDASQEAVRDALTVLHANDFLSEAADDTYTLNNDADDLTAAIHDAYIEYQADQRY